MKYKYIFFDVIPLVPRRKGSDNSKFDCEISKVWSRIISP